MSWYTSYSGAGDKATIVTPSGHEVHGRVHHVEGWAPDDAGDMLFTVLTLGLTTPDPRVTVVDSHGNFWTGQER